MEEFFFLLDNIEERLSAGYDLYSNSNVIEAKLRKIIRYDTLLCSNLSSLIIV